MVNKKTILTLLFSLGYIFGIVAQENKLSQRKDMFMIRTQHPNHSYVALYMKIANITKYNTAGTQYNAKDPFKRLRETYILFPFGNKIFSLGIPETDYSLVAIKDITLSDTKLPKKIFLSDKKDKLKIDLSNEEAEQLISIPAAPGKYENDGKKILVNRTSEKEVIVTLDQIITKMKQARQAKLQTAKAETQALQTRK